MTRKTIIILLLAAFMALLTGCEAGFTKSRIANAMREYIQPMLSPEESYAFVGLTNNRDTVYMEVTRPCAGVIYTIENTATGHKERHFADVIFSNDYKVALNVTELDFDPIDYAEEKVKAGFRKAFKEFHNR